MSATSVERLNTALGGRYRVERQLGEGGMATVYLADDLRHERKVALKVLKPELAAVVGAERFLAEIKTTANLQHPHILPLFDSGEADGFLFYVMPYVEGESLAERLAREHQLPVPEAVAIAAKVAGALQAAHDRGVIHRDVKPANILLSKGEPLVSDFGIALAVGAAGGGRLTETGLSLGTPHYMSPEQATGDVSVGPATDVYALGCVLYEMLVGEPPYTGSTPQAILGKIIQAEPVSATRTRRTVPVNVDAAIGRALEKVPADRFESAAEFSRALADPAFRNEGPLAAGRGGSAGPWKRVAIGSTVLAVAASAVAVAGLRRPTSPVPVAWYAISLPPDQASVPILDNRLALAPDGSSFVYVGVGPGSVPQLWLRRRDQPLATPIPGTEGAANPAISPDGTRVAFVATTRGARRLMAVSLRGGPALELTDSLVDGGGVTWADDGYVYYDGHLEGDGLARVREVGGVPEVATTPDVEAGEVYHQQPSALPNGRGVLFVRRGRTFDVAVLDLATGQHKVLVQDALGPRYSPTGHLLFVRPSGALQAVPFDLATLFLTGPEVPLAEGVQANASTGRADLAVGLDGTLMYVSSGGAPLYEMAWVARDGTSSVIDPDWQPSDVGAPALSPDGRQLAVTVAVGTAREVWIKQLDSGRYSRISDGAYPSWSPDGRSVVYASQEGNDRAALYIRPADQSAPARLLYRDPSRSIVFSKISADGRWLAYQGNADVLAVRLDSLGLPEGEPISVATQPFNELFTALSPDGRWIAFAADDGGGAQIYVCAFPSVCDAKYQVSPDGGFAPVWGRDGRELFYYTPPGVLASVEVRLGPSFDWGRPETLFDGAGLRPEYPLGTFDVAPDGRRFVFARAVNARPPEFVVVQNFSEVLRRMVEG